MIQRRIALAGLALAPLAACKAAEPHRAPAAPLAQKSATGLVELVKLDPSIRLDIRYATPHNFTGRVLYPQARAFLQEAAAKALVAAHQEIGQAGYGLTIFDGYRPAHVTQLMWDVTPRSKRGFVADPREGSRHNRGCAVDLSLHDRKTGALVEMPSAYDEFSARAHQDYPGGTTLARANRALLRDLMQSHGFFALAHEWWHFDFASWRDYPLLDVPFSAL